MKTIVGSALVLYAFVCLSASAAAQAPVGAMRIDERQGDQYGWAVDYETAAAAAQRTLSVCDSGCSVVLTVERCAAYAADQEASTAYGWAESYDSAVRVWGCNGAVVEAGLGLDRAARRQGQAGIQAAGFDRHTRSVIRSWQASRAARATDYLDGASMAALWPSATGRPTFREREPAGAVAAAHRPGEVFRDCAECPEMVALAGGGLAMGRYEVTVGEYRAFVSATGGGAGGECDGDSWRDPGYPQTDRHPVACVSWDDAQEYVSWLSRRTGTSYRLPSEVEWERAASGSQPGCDRLGRGTRLDGTCPVGQYGMNAAGLSDMVGNLWEWTSDCWNGDCGRRVVRGGSWFADAEYLRPGTLFWFTAGLRSSSLLGFRVSRTLD